MSQLPFAPLAPAIVPRYYQSEAADAIFNAWIRDSTCAPCAVLPTGSGKSLLLALLCQRTLTAGGRVMVLQPSIELIRQNADELRRLVPGIDVGTYSAGLRKRDTDHDVVFAGIQSCYAKAHEFGRRDVVLIDESHLLPPDGEGRFRTFLKDLRDLCPHFRLAGMTATPYRTGSGALCGPENLLTKVVYTAQVGKLIAEGYLCPVVNKPPKLTFDTSKCRVNSRTHELDQGQEAAVYANEEVLIPAIHDLIANAIGRHSNLIFCAGVKNAVRAAELIEQFTGEPARVIVGDKQITTDLERAQYLRDFDEGRLRWLVNVDCLTTGVNVKRIDHIGLLRTILSPGLVAQMIGRGFRLHESKADCLVSDYGGNVARHGPIDSETYGLAADKAQRDSDGDGEAPKKECPSCNEQIPISMKVCPECGFVYPEKPRHNDKSDNNSAILQSQIEPIEYIVEAVAMARHEKRGDPHAPNTLRVDYTCQLAEGGGNLSRKVISEWVCLDHDADDPKGRYARANAGKWWRERSKATLEIDLNDSRIDSAIELWQRGAVAVANRLWVVPQGRFSKIVRQSLDEIPTTWDDPPSPSEGETVDEWGMAAADVPF